MNGKHLKLIEHKRSPPGTPLSLQTIGSQWMQKRLLSVQETLVGNALLPPGRRHRKHKQRFGHAAPRTIQAATSLRAKQNS